MTMQRVYDPDTKQYEMQWVLPADVPPGAPTLLPGDTGPGRSLPLFTTAARNALGASLFRGLTIFNTDTGAIEVYYGATTLWMPPWNLPWGEVAYALAAPQSGIGAATLATATITALANRKYRITAAVTLKIAAGSTTATVNVTANGVSSGIRATLGLAASERSLIVIGYRTPAAGSIAYALTEAPDAGTVDANSIQSETFVLVEDVGPNGSAPSP